MTLFAILALGFLFGVRHATDSDHVIAVSTIVSRERSASGALRVGALWGLGHSATLLAVGGALVGFGWIIPPRLGLSMEMSVAVMLIVLGTLNLSGALSHLTRGAHPHLHPAGLERGSVPALRTRVSLRPLLIGIVHGLAGSAAVALLVLATIRSVATALLYLALFGLGTVVGMMLLTLLLSLPLSALSRRFPSMQRPLARVAGAVSIVFGLVLAYQIGVGDGLVVGTPTWAPH